MEKINLHRLDSLVLGSSTAVTDFERLVSLTCDLISEESDHSLQQALRTCIGIESQLRLREIAQQPAFNKVMENALKAKGVCSMEVLLKKVEEIIQFKELHQLVLLRSHSTLKIISKYQNESLKVSRINQELKNELDKLPNLRASFVEALFGQWYLSKKKSDEYIYAALHLASGEQNPNEVVIVGLFLHHLCIKKRDSPLNEKDSKTVELFKTKNTRT